MFFNLVGILCLVCGWIFCIKWLVIVGLISSVFWLLVTIIAFLCGGKFMKYADICAFMRVAVVVLSIIYLTR